MIQTIQLITMIVPIALLGFWIWMFWAMTNNARLPSGSSSSLGWPPSSKFDWTLAFIFLNVFAAVYYYFIEYRNQSR